MSSIQYTTHSVEETLALGHNLGRFMKYYEGPICIALDGTLGAGKTHFSQGIAKGFGVTWVHSTFLLLYLSLIHI